MTFVDESGNFGALGHGIKDIVTSTLMNLESGKLFQTEIVCIKRGESGNPGELTGAIDYDSEKQIGNITVNSEKGIFGECNLKITCGHQWASSL